MDPMEAYGEMPLDAAQKHKDLMRKRPVLSNRELDDLHDRFECHAPETEDIRLAHEIVDQEMHMLAIRLIRLIPQSRGLRKALTKLEECRMWANQAIATGQKLRGDVKEGL